MTAVDRRSGHPLRRAVLVPVVLAILLVAGWYGIAWVRHTSPLDGFAAFAHRGGPSTTGAPEGTLAAFAAAIEAGADGLELDVRATRDGVLVVLHDERVDRTTDGIGGVADLTYGEVERLDAGDGTRIPRVEEVVRLAREAGVPLLAEIKDGPLHPEVAPALVELLDREGYLGRTVIEAFEPAELERIHALRPGVETCLLTGAWPFDPTAVPGGTRSVCLMGEMVLLAPDMIRQAHAAGLRVLAWWGAAESGPADAILRAYGVDGLIVDDLGPVTP